MIHQWQKWEADVYGYTVWHYIFAGSNFCGFFHDPQKKVPAKKNFPQKFSLQKFTPLSKLYTNIAF